MIIILKKFASIFQDERRSGGWYAFLLFSFSFSNEWGIVFCIYWLLSYNSFFFFSYTISGFYLILIFIHVGHDLIFKNVPFCISLALSSHYFMCRFHDFKFIVGFGHIIVCCFLQEIIWCGMWGLTTYKINWFFFLLAWSILKDLWFLKYTWSINCCSLVDYLFILTIMTFSWDCSSIGHNNAIARQKLWVWASSIPTNPMIWEFSSFEIMSCITCTLSQLILSYIYSIHSYLGRAMCFC